MKKFCVIGSINMDITARVERFPQPGETIVGTGFGTYPGGKGANQAISLGKLGADVMMIGKLGDDMYGKQYFDILRNNTVEIQALEFVQNTSTGVAVIEVNRKGENHIVLVPGANGQVDAAYIKTVNEFIFERDIVLLQLEIPFETNAFILKYFSRFLDTVILDPAPARIIPDDLLEHIDYITPNRTEASQLTGISIQNEDDIEQAGKILVDHGVRNVIITSGEDGSYLINDNGFIHVPAYFVNPADTTGAGDAFNAGLAYSLGEGKQLYEAILFANATAAISVTEHGAQSGMPSLEQVEDLQTKQAH